LIKKVVPYPVFSLVPRPGKLSPWDNFIGWNADTRRQVIRLAINTFVYEVGKVPIEKALRGAEKFGFKFIDLAAYNSGDPTLISKAKSTVVWQKL